MDFQRGQDVKRALNIGRVTIVSTGGDYGKGVELTVSSWVWDNLKEYQRIWRMLSKMLLELSLQEAHDHKDFSKYYDKQKRLSSEIFDKVPECDKYWFRSTWKLKK